MSRHQDKIAKGVLRQLYASQDPFGFSVKNELSALVWNHPGKEEGEERRSALVETWRLAELIER